MLYPEMGWIEEFQESNPGYFKITGRGASEEYVNSIKAQIESVKADENHDPEELQILERGLKVITDKREFDWFELEKIQPGESEAQK